jgi:hypothetical protein
VTSGNGQSGPLYALGQPGKFGKSRNPDTLGPSPDMKMSGSGVSVEYVE